MKRPKEVNILGIIYQIQYVDNPAEVDMHKRKSLWGQIDYWTRTIRIYSKDRPEEDIWETIIHEVLHGIAEGLHLKSMMDDKNEDELDILSLALADVLFRNNWFNRK